MNNIVTTDINTNVVVVTAPGPSGPVGPQGPQGERGTVEANSGFLATPFLNVSGAMAVSGSSTFSGNVVMTGSLTVSGSNTFINIGPALFTGSVGVSGSLTATLFSGSGAGLTGIPASGITGLNLSRIATGAVSASVATGGTAFTLNTGGTNLFTVSSTGLGIFTNGLTVNGSSTSINNGLIVANGATLNGGTTIGTSLNVNGTATVSNLTVSAGGVTTLQGTATLNGADILTSATVSTNRISDSSISASVSSTSKAFNVTNGATSLMSVDQNGAISGSGLYVSGSAIYIDGPTIRLYGNATLNNAAITTTATTTTDRIQSGTITASVATFGNAFTVQDSGNTVASINTSGQVSASSFIGDGSGLTGVGIQYNSGSNPLITSIEVADFDTGVAVTFVDGNLKFVFGTPIVPSAPAISFNGTFDTNRFNLQTDNYTATATWAVGGYSLVRASMVDLSTGIEVASTTSGTSLPFNTTTSGSQSYRIAVTASSPLDGSTNIQTATVTGTLSKGAPSNPVLTPTANVQLGTTSGIETGATGSISFTAAYGASDNGWERVSLVSSSVSPVTVTATSTPSVTLTANYQSPAGTNSTTATTSTSDSFTYSRIISLRYGASPATSFSEGQLQNLALWDTTVGGTIGTIVKGTTSPNGQTITINTVDTVGGSYLYIIYSNSISGTLTIIQNLQNVTNNFNIDTVGSYKVFRSKNLVYGNATLSLSLS